MRHLSMPRMFNSGQAFTIVVVIVLTLLVARGCDFSLPLTATQKAAEKADLAEQAASWAEARADRAQRAPLDLALYILSRVAGLALIVAAVGGAISVLTLRGVRWAATINPVGGLFPIVLGRLGGTWRIHDPNRQIAATTRLNDGHGLLPDGWEPAQLATTVGALTVQAEQARSYNAQVAPAAAPTAVEPAGETAPVMNWPVKVPLSGLLKMQGGATTENIVWGMTLNSETGQQEVLSERLDKLCHVAVGGSSGWGKSRFVEMITYQLLAARETLGVGMIDLKREHVFFNQFDLMWPVATKPEEAKAIFLELSKELDRRLDVMGGALSLDEYNSKRNGAPELTPIALVGDECTALFKSGDAELTAGIQNLALLGRSAGLFLIMAGQNWKVGNVGGSETRDQFSSKAQFKANSKSQSRLLVDCPDAAELSDPGRAVVIMPGRERTVMQGAFVDRTEIERALSGSAGPRYPMPAIIDLTPGQAPNSLSDAQRAQIVELDRSGASVTNIVKTVWGSKNGRRMAQVRAILASDG